MLAIVVGLLPTLAFVLHDFVFQLPDNHHEVTVGFVATTVALPIVWGLTGYLAAARGRHRIVRGAVAAAASVLVLGATFIALNELFVDRMSYEPDRVRAFQRSGYPTMKEYMHAQRGSGPFPLLLGVAAAAGTIGGAINRK